MIGEAGERARWQGCDAQTGMRLAFDAPATTSMTGRCSEDKVHFWTPRLAENVTSTYFNTPGKLSHHLPHDT